MSKIKKIQLEFSIPNLHDLSDHKAKFILDLSKWYCDDIYKGKKEGAFIFSWKGEGFKDEEIFYIRENKDNSISYYKHSKKTEDKSKCYFELKIKAGGISEISGITGATGDGLLTISEFINPEEEGEEEEEICKSNWEEGIKRLKKSLGV